MKLLQTLFFLGSVGLTFALSSPDNKLSLIEIKHRYFLFFKDINDFSLATLSNKKGEFPVCKAKWSKGSSGDATCDLNKYLVEGNNTLVISLYNKKGRYGSGYSAKYKFLSDTKVIWQKKLSNKGLEEEIVFWKLFNIEVSKDGLVSIDEQISKAQIESITPKLQALEKYLNIRYKGETSLKENVQKVKELYGISKVLGPLFGLPLF